MTDHNLHVITAFSSPYLDPPASPDDFPEGLSGSLSSYGGGDIPIPEGAATLVLSDDAALLRRLSADKPERLRLVWIGAPEEAAGFEDALDDLWHPSEGGVRLRRRYLRLLCALRDEFDLWFYKSALLTTINAVPDMLWYKRLDGIHMLVNDAFSKITHKPKCDIHGKDHFYIWNAPRPTEGCADFSCASSEENAVSSGKLYVCNEPVRTGEGMKQFTTYKAPLYDVFGNVYGTVGVGHDVTGLDNLGVQLSMLVENLPFPICIFDPSWHAVQMNSEFGAIVGVDIGAPEADFFDYRVWKVKNFIPVGSHNTDSLNHAATQEVLLRQRGKTRRFIVNELEIRNAFGDVTGYFSTLEDVTYRRAYERSILEAANTDMLTGIYNRRYFVNFVRSSAGRPFHLLFMDLDHFKEINDLHGHKAGDTVLIRVAEYIQRFFPGMVAARLGGDEFVVVDEDHDRATIDRRCAEFEQAIADDLGELVEGASVSVGVAYTDGSPDDIDRVLHDSDKQMYEIKKRHHSGRLRQ